MGTASKDFGQGQQQQGQQGQASQQGNVQGNVGSPISNEAYNVISALAAKLEGLEAYRKYSKDAGGQIWQQLTQVEIQGVEQLVSELERLVKDGKLRMRSPGQGNA